MARGFRSQPRNWLARAGIHLLALAGVGFGITWAAQAQEMEMERPGAGAASARSKLEALRKSREKQEKKTKPEKAAAARADGSIPWDTPDDVTYIDTLLGEEWEALGFPVSDQCTDGEFIRRASLDVIGRIPTLGETQEFLRSPPATRRKDLVNRLLASDEYGANWATIWNRMLITTADGDNDEGAMRENMRAWLEKEFNRNTPWTKMVQEMVGGTGQWQENGAVNFMIANMDGGNAIRATSNLSKLFLGVQTQCTECHNHPWNEWKQEQFHGMRAFFAGTRERRVTTTSPGGQQVTDYIVLDEMPLEELGEKGVFYEPRNGLTLFVPPTYVDGRDINAILHGEKARGAATELTTEDGSSTATAELRLDDEPAEATGQVYLRKELATVMTADDNPYFARAVVNRLWYHYFGHSFVKAVDDFDNGQDEPSMPDLLDRLSNDFRTNGYDLKRLTRWICTSKAYSLSSRQKPAKGEDSTGFFNSMLVKPLTAAQLYDSVLTLTQVHKTGKSDDTGAERQRFLGEFQRTFGSSEIPTMAPKYEGTISSSLMMMNSPLMTRATECLPGSFLHGLVTNKGMSQVDQVNAIYLAALCRQPTGPERQYVGRLFQSAQSTQEALQDVLWVILNSSEFSLNH